jgi:hypothetical protein
METIARRISKPCIGVEAFKQIAKGDFITYLLPAHMQPTNPLKEWHGRVEQVNAEAVLVSSLDKGYYGDTETVMRREIISVTKSAE